MASAFCDNNITSRSWEILVGLVWGLLSFTVLILIIQVILARKSSFKAERVTPLESGFESLSSRISLRAPFFFLAILFVLFDLELVLFFPGVISLFRDYSCRILWILVNFVVIVTLIIEWSFCGLKWQI